MLRKIKSHLAVFLMLALAFTLLIPAPVQAASKKKPAKVTVTSVKASGTNKVVIKWRKAKYATNYRIYWKQAGTKKWRTLATVKSNRTSYTHKSNSKAKLIGGKKYVYTVRAYNRYGRKWGAYNSKGKTVKIPKRKAAVPTKTPVKPKPTTPAKPIQPVKPTAVPTHKPKPTVKPATPTPVPTKKPQPTATPVPAKPTEAPKPTAAPAPVKVSSVTINPSTVKLTSKGQTAQLSASVLPSNAENKSIRWNSMNTDVVTVSNAGTITVVANGSATIIAEALDGSGKFGSCAVTVEIPDENSQVITVQGGKGGNCFIAPGEFDGVNLQNVEMEIQGNNDIIGISGKGYDSSSWCAFVDFKAQRKGSVSVIAKYENRILRRWTINVTSDWTEYIGYVNWRKQVESQIWTNGMSIKEKCDAAQGYIKTQFTYKSGYGQAVLIYNDKMCDCIGASDLMGGFAKDANAQIKYCSNRGTQPHDYLADATSEGGHTFTMILIDGKWVSYDAQP